MFIDRERGDFLFDFRTDNERFAAFRLGVVLNFLNEGKSGFILAEIFFADVGGVDYGF